MTLGPLCLLLLSGAANLRSSSTIDAPFNTRGRALLSCFNERTPPVSGKRKRLAQAKPFRLWPKVKSLDGSPMSALRGTWTHWKNPESNACPEVPIGNFVLKGM
jgi:hypothetical protein